MTTPYTAGRDGGPGTPTKRTLGKKACYYCNCKKGGLLILFISKYQSCPETCCETLLVLIKDILSR